MPIETANPKRNQALSERLETVLRRIFICRVRTRAHQTIAQETICSVHYLVR